MAAVDGGVPGLSTVSAVLRVLAMLGTLEAR
jgi:hypothetical protein